MICHNVAAYDKRTDLDLNWKWLWQAFVFPNRLMVDYKKERKILCTSQKKMTPAPGESL